MMENEIMATASSSRMKETLAIIAFRNIFSEKMFIRLFIELNSKKVKKHYSK